MAASIFAPVADYEHHRTGEDNGDAHLKRMLVNHQVMLPITKGKLDFGPWEQVFYAEFDGQRKKRIILKAVRRLIVKGGDAMRRKRQTAVTL